MWIKIKLIFYPNLFFDYGTLIWKQRSELWRVSSVVSINFKMVTEAVHCSMRPNYLPLNTLLELFVPHWFPHLDHYLWWAITHVIDSLKFLKIDLIGERWHLMAALTCISMMMSLIEHFSICILAVCISSFVNYLFWPLPLLKRGIDYQAWVYSIEKFKIFM